MSLAPPRPGWPVPVCTHSWSAWSGAFWAQLSSFRSGRPIRMERRQARVCQRCGDREERATNA